MSKVIEIAAYFEQYSKRFGTVEKKYKIGKQYNTIEDAISFIEKQYLEGKQGNLTYKEAEKEVYITTFNYNGVPSNYRFKLLFKTKK